MRSALVVAAHPDDEVLGAGGAIARLSAEGTAVHLLVLGEGATSRARRRGAGAGNSRAVRTLRRCAQAAADALGVASIEFRGLPDNRFDTVALLDIAKTVEEHLGRVGPEAVFTHFAGDLNVDHRLTFEAVMTACRPLPGSNVREVMSFEVPSSTGWAGPGCARCFQPTLYVDVSDYMAAKLRALKAYAPEMRGFPHARSVKAVEALAAWRGAEAGLGAAEAFVLVRMVR